MNFATESQKHDYTRREYQLRDLHSRETFTNAGCT